MKVYHLNCKRCGAELTLSYIDNVQCRKCGLSYNGYTYSLRIDKFTIDFISQNEQTRITWSEEKSQERQPSLLEYVINNGIDEKSKIEMEEFLESVRSQKFVIPKETVIVQETKKFVLNRLFWAISKEDIEKYILLI